MMKRFVSSLLILLGACSFAPRDTGSGFMFALAPLTVVQPGLQKEALVVMSPTTAPELDTQRIALLKDGRRWDYYAGARWSDFMPSLVQDNLARTLENARLFKSVVTDEAGLEGDRLLKTEIRAFQAEYAPGASAPTVRIEMRLSLVTRLERRPVASFTVAAGRKAAGPRLTDIQAAFAAAFNEAERQVVAQMGGLSQ